MHTMTAAKQYIRRDAMPDALVITHTPGHVDRRGIDRGFSVMTIDSVKDFPFPIDGIWEVTKTGKRITYTLTPCSVYRAKSLRFTNQLVYEEVLNWLGFAFESDGRLNAGIGLDGHHETPADLAANGEYGMQEAERLMRIYGR
jgi:hypothetical protein